MKHQSQNMVGERIYIICNSGFAYHRQIYAISQKKKEKIIIKKKPVQIRVLYSHAFLLLKKEK